VRLNPHLSFNGQCEEAFRFYEQLLPGKVTLLMKHGESPLAAESPANMLDKVLHATLTFGRPGDGQRLTGADEFPENYGPARGYSVLLMADSAAEAERIFAGLAQGGTTQMEMQETFWAIRFGMCTDRFGIPWLVNTERPVASEATRL
jgi:PhnB protein